MTVLYRMSLSWRMVQAWWKNEKSAVVDESEQAAPPSHRSAMYQLLRDGRTMAITDHEDQVIGPPPWRSRALSPGASVGTMAGKGVNRPVDQFHRVQGDERPKYDLPQGQE